MVITFVMVVHFRPTIYQNAYNWEENPWVNPKMYKDFLEEENDQEDFALWGTSTKGKVPDKSNALNAANLVT